MDSFARRFLTFSLAPCKGEREKVRGLGSIG